MSDTSDLVLCSHCGLSVIDHVPITWMACLSALSGEIEVYRKNLKKEKTGKYT